MFNVYELVIVVTQQAISHLFDLIGNISTVKIEETALAQAKAENAYCHFMCSSAGPCRA